MRALVLRDFGSAPELAEIELPEPAAGEVRVRVHAASVNGFDVAVANGYTKGMMEHRFPLVLGKDFAGIVDSIGEDVSGYQVGDRVFGVVTKDFLGDGSFAEFVTVRVAAGLAKLPDGVEFTEAAALGLAGSAATDAVDAAALQPGQTVLVAGATGGVGNQAVQLAVRAGAHVIATASTDDERKLVTELGAAETVDYTGDITTAVRSAHPQGVDVVLHFAGDPAAILASVRDGGRFVSTLLMSPDQLPSETATVVPIYATPSQSTLDRVSDGHAAGHTKVNVNRVYGLDQAITALTDFTTGTLGKLVIVTTK